MVNELVIRVKIEDEDGLLAGFPFEDGQYADGRLDEHTPGDTTWLVVDLGGRRDTTTAQEQFLNAKDAVIEYGIH